MKKTWKVTVMAGVLAGSLLANACTAFAATSLSGLREELAGHLGNYEATFSVHYSGDSDDLLSNGGLTPLRDLVNDILAGDEYLSTNWQSMRMGLSGMIGNRSNLTLTFSMEWLTSAEKEKRIDAKLTEILASLIPADAEDAEKVRLVHDYIVTHVTYAAVDASSHSAYAALFDGKAVCQGYASLAYRMLERLNVPVEIVEGSVNGDPNQRHAWNLVQVDGRWRHLDVTWDDPVGATGTVIRTDYYLLTDAEMAVDHAWDADEVPCEASADLTVTAAGKTALVEQD